MARFRNDKKLLLEIIANCAIFVRDGEMAFLINHLVKAFIPLSLFVLAIFMPKTGSYAFICLCVVMLLYFIVLFLRTPNISYSKWSTEEIRIIHKYGIALFFPPKANFLLAQVNAFRWVGLLFFTPWLLFSDMWIEAGLIIGNFVITSPMCIRLNPFFFLGQAVDLGRKQYASELALLKKVSEKLGQADSEDL